MTAAACLIAQEYAVRFTLPDYDPGKQPRFTSGGLDRPPLGIPNTTARLAKNSGDYNVTVRFNRRGLRDLKDVSDARPGDISVVGDSFAFGWGVEEKQTLSQRLEARTGRAVFNLGAPGDLRDYAAMLAYARGLGARNDDVVLAFNMSNDILDYDSSQNAQPDIPAERPSLLQHVKGLLTETSALYFLATSIINRSGVIRGLAMKFGFVVPLSAVPPRDVSDGLIEGTVRRLQAIAEGALKGLDARTLGAARWRVFATITLPLALPGILTGALLSFARSLGEFGATITFVSNIPGETQTLPLAIYSATHTPGGDAVAARLAALSFALALAGLIASEVLARRLGALIGRS